MAAGLELALELEPVRRAAVGGAVLRLQAEVPADIVGIRKLTRRRLQRGVFHSLVDVQAAINCFLTEYNQARKPFTWSAEPEAIPAKVKREHQTLETVH